MCLRRYAKSFAVRTTADEQLIREIAKNSVLLASFYYSGNKKRGRKREKINERAVIIFYDDLKYI